MRNLCCGRRRWCAVCLWSLRNDKYSLGPGPVSILQWSILTSKLFLYFSRYFHSPSSFSWHKLLKCGSLSVTSFSSLKSATFGRFYAFSSCQKLPSKSEEKFNIFIKTQLKICSQLGNSIHSHTSKHRSILTVLVDLPAEVLLVRGVRGAGQQEVGPGLGGPNEIALIRRLVEEWVRAQSVLITVALVAV